VPLHNCTENEYFYLTQGLGITLQVFWRQGDNPPSVKDLQLKITCKIAEHRVLIFEKNAKTRETVF
jgi:hypothetical protein